MSWFASGLGWPTGCAGTCTSSIRPCRSLAGLRRDKVIQELAGRLAGVEGTVARLARQLLARCRELTVEINALEAELRPLVRRLAPTLLAVPGCGVLGRR